MITTASGRAWTYSKYPTFDAKIPIYAGRRRTRPHDSRGALHWHPNHYEIVLLAEGSLTFFSDFQQHSVKAKALALISPGQLHGWLGDWSGVCMDVVGFQAATLGKLLHMLDLPYFEIGMVPVIELSHEEECLFTALFDAMLRHFRTTPTFAELIESYLHTLLLEIRRIYTAQMPMLAASRPVSLVREFRHLLNLHYMERWTVHDYALQMGITANHLVKTVKQIMGRTPGQMVQERLYLEARRMLSQSYIPINEIAEQLAFVSPSQFGHWFKKFGQCSPAAFRKEILRSLNRPPNGSL